MRKKGSNTLDQLSQLSASEFEEYVKDLFEDLGYEKLNLRGRSGDQGVDILAESKGEKVAIQCKRNKGKVSSADVRQLLGSMHATESQRGFFVTTGMFSLPAERAAREAPIQLVDGPSLIELIAEARTK